MVQYGPPPRESSVTTGGNRSTRRKPAMLGRDKLDSTLLTYDQGNFNQITAQSRNRTLAILKRTLRVRERTLGKLLKWISLTLLGRLFCSREFALLFRMMKIKAQLRLPPKFSRQLYLQFSRQQIFART